jgi:hypothetical protein
MDIIDPISSNIIYQLEAYYRTVKNNLSHSANVSTEGDAFSLLPTSQTSQNREFYGNLLHMLAAEAIGAKDSLEKSAYCDNLAATPWIYYEPRPRPNLAK